MASTASFPLPSDVFFNGMRVFGSSSGPVNTEEADRDFFTDPRFDQGGNSGRLFYHQFFLHNPHDPHIPERRVWFISWSPLDDGERIQRLPERDGCLIEEITTDGKGIQIHYAGHPGTNTMVESLQWAGNGLGKGRFEPEPGGHPLAAVPNPTPFQTQRDRGYGLLSDRKPAEAVAAFERALALQAGDPGVLFALGVAWEEVSQSSPDPAASKAIEAYSLALWADPHRIPAYRRRADVHRRQGKIDLAIADLTQVIDLEPEDWEARLDRAALHAKAGDYGKAIADAQEAAGKAPSETAPMETLARYQYRSGRFDEAVATGQRLLALDDSRTPVRVTMALAQARLGQAALALKTYADARDNGVTSTERRWGIGELQRWLKTSPEAGAKGGAARALLDQLRGTEELEAEEEDLE